jgi:hypothetical protein
VPALREAGSGGATDGVPSGAALYPIRERRQPEAGLRA